MMNKNKVYAIKQAGFTLLEVLLSISVIIIITGISIPLYQSFQNRNDLEIAAITTAQSLRRAQILSQGMDGDTNSGVHIQSGDITVFHGVNYSSRDITLDEIFTIPSSIVTSGIPEVIFNKFTGLPQTTGTITFTSVNNEVRNITINEKGMVNY